jgi:hypothetical protein
MTDKKSNAIGSKSLKLFFNIKAVPGPIFGCLKTSYAIGSKRLGLDKITERIQIYCVFK